MRKTTIAVMSVSLIVAITLSLTTTDWVWATTNNSTGTDYDLLYEAEQIEMIEQNIKYDESGQMRGGTQNESQERHQEIVQELNSRGIYHKSQTFDTSLEGYRVVDSTTTNGAGNQIDVVMYSPIEDTIDPTDNVCCGGTHNKKLSVRAGIEWPNEHFPWWKHWIVGPWSSYSNSFGASTAETVSGHDDMKMYFHTKSDHAVTTASFTISSDVMVKTTSGGWTTIDDASVFYSGVYYPYIYTLKGDYIGDEHSLSGPTRNVVSMSIHSIS